MESRGSKSHHHDEPPKPKPTRSTRDENWKEQIRRAIEDSRRNIAMQEAQRSAPDYRYTLNAPEISKSYYDMVRTHHIMQLRKGHTSTHHAKSDSEIARQGKAGYRKTVDGSNVVSTHSRLSGHKHKRHTRHGESGSEDDHKDKTAGESESESNLLTEGQSQTAGPSTSAETTEVLSYFDPAFVKGEYKEILEKSRNIVIGPPREILKKYFGYTDADPLPDDLLHDSTPKAFILPRKLWKDYDDTAHVAEAAKKAASATTETSKKKSKAQDDSPNLGNTDRNILRKMEEEKEVEPYIPRQPKHFAVDFIARKPFKKYGMLSSNLNDASPGMMEHLEMKDVNVDPGGHLRREHTDNRFQISEVSETPVKVAPKEGKMKDEKRPWYADGWAEGADPNIIAKSPNFTTGGDDLIYNPSESRGKPTRGGKSKSNRSDEDGGLGRRTGSSPRRRRRGSSTSEGSDGSSDSSGGYSCTCGESSSSSGSSSEGTGSDAGSDQSPKKSRSKSRKRRAKKDNPDEDPSTKSVGVDAHIPDYEVPSWAPPTWKPPEGYKGWIYNPKVSQSTPNASVNIDDQDPNRVPGSDWFRAFGVVKKAEKEGEVEKLRDILGHIDDEDDLFRLTHPELEREDTEGEEEEEDVMERIPRGDLPFPHQYPEYPTAEQFQYYRSYPLYPTLSSERFFEWYKDVDRLTNPFQKRRYQRPAGLSKSMGHIDWNDAKQAAKWYAYGYRPPDTKPKPVRPDHNTKDYIYDNARSIMLMPSRKVVPKYIDDRKGTSHLLEPSGLVKKFVFRGDFGRVPEYLMGRNEELGRPAYPDMDKFYRPHRCKYLHAHIHCKICMRAHPTVKTRKIDWNCDMTPRDYERALEYRRSRMSDAHSTSTARYSYKSDSHHDKSEHGADDIEHILEEFGLGEEYRRSKSTRGSQNSTRKSSVHSHHVDNVVLPPIYV